MKTVDKNEQADNDNTKSDPFPSHFTYHARKFKQGHISPIRLQMITILTNQITA